MRRCRPSSSRFCCRISSFLSLIRDTAADGVVGGGVGVVVAVVVVAGAAVGVVDSAAGDEDEEFSSCLSCV